MSNEQPNKKKRFVYKSMSAQQRHQNTINYNERKSTNGEFPNNLNDIISQPTKKPKLHIERPINTNNNASYTRKEQHYNGDNRSDRAIINGSSRSNGVLNDNRFQKTNNNKNERDNINDFLYDNGDDDFMMINFDNGKPNNKKNTNNNGRKDVSIDFDDGDYVDFGEDGFAEIDKIEIAASQQVPLSTGKFPDNADKRRDKEPDTLDELLGLSGTRKAHSSVTSSHSNKTTTKRLIPSSSVTFTKQQSSNSQEKSYVHRPSPTKIGLQNSPIKDNLQNQYQVQKHQQQQEYEQNQQQYKQQQHIQQYENQQQQAALIYQRQFTEAQKSLNEYKTKLENIEKKFNSKDGEIKILREKLRKSSEDDHKMRERILSLESSMKVQQSEKEANILRELEKLQTQLEFKEKEVHDLLEKQKYLESKNRSKQPSPKRRKVGKSGLLQDGFKNDKQTTKTPLPQLSPQQKQFPISKMKFKRRPFSNSLQASILKKSHTAGTEITNKMSELSICSTSYTKHVDFPKFNGYCLHCVQRQDENLKIYGSRFSGDLMSFVLEMQRSIDLVEQNGFYVPDLIIRLTHHLRCLDELFQAQIDNSGDRSQIGNTQSCSNSISANVDKAKNSEISENIQRTTSKQYKKICTTRSQTSSQNSLTSTNEKMQSRHRSYSPITCTKCKLLYEIGYKSLFVLREACAAYEEVRRFLLRGFALKHDVVANDERKNIPSKTIDDVKYFYKFPDAESSIIVEKKTKIVMKNVSKKSKSDERIAVQLWEMLFVLVTNKFWTPPLQEMFFKFNVHLLSNSNSSPGSINFIKHLSEKDQLSSYLSVSSIDRVLDVLQLLLNASALKEVVLVLCSKSERCPLLTVYNVLLSNEAADVSNPRMLLIFEKLVCLLLSLLTHKEIEPYSVILSSACQCSTDIIECLITFLFIEFKQLRRRVFHPSHVKLEKHDEDRLDIFQSGMSLLCKLCSHDRQLSEKRSEVEWSYLNLLVGTIKMYRKIPSISENEVIAIEDLLEQDQYLEFDSNSPDEDEIRDYPTTQQPQDVEMKAV